MKKTNGKYLYAQKAEQIKRANHFLTIGVGVYYAWILIIIWVATIRGIRSAAFSGAVTAIIVVFSVLEGIDYSRSSSSLRAKYIASMGLFFVSTFMAIGFNNDYVRFMAVTPFIGSILYYDRKFSKITGIAFSLMNICANVIKIGILHAYTGERLIEQLCATLAICIMFIIIYITAAIGWQFNFDTIHSLMEEQEKQQELLAEVLKVAGEVRNGTNDTMELVKDLHSSTEIVDGAMQDISESMQSTAVNIQMQTEMTQNIQQAIKTTRDHSESMMQTAQKSEELNQRSIAVMKELKKHSEAITGTNVEVAASMKKLQERTNMVKNIAATIFDISNQTNLLALNASIESARAGEAGRGFAVVAEQIRQLAEKTKQETEGIAEIVRELSLGAQEASEAVGKSVVVATEQDDIIGQVSESFGSMNENVASLVKDVEEIDRMILGLSQANNQIVEDIMQLSAATEEVTAAASQAEELSNTNLRNSETAKTLLQSVLEVSHRLDTYIA